MSASQEQKQFNDVAVSSASTNSTNLTSLTSKPGSSADAQNDSQSARKQRQRPALLKTMSNASAKKNTYQQPPFRRAQSIRDKISVETHKFFGVPICVTPDLESPPSQLEALANQFEADQKWQHRRFRHLKTAYGVNNAAVSEKLQKRPALVDSHIELTDQSLPTQLVDPLASSSMRSSRGSRVGEAWVFGSSGSQLQRRDSVAKITYNTLSLLLHGNAFKKTFKRFDAFDEPFSAYTSIRERNQCCGVLSFPNSPITKSFKMIDEEDASILELAGATSLHCLPDEFTQQRSLHPSFEFAGLSTFPVDVRFDRARTLTETSRHTLHTVDQQRRIGFRQTLINKEKRHTHDSAISKLRSAIENAKQQSWSELTWWQRIFTTKRHTRRRLPIFGKFKRQKSRDPFLIRQLADESCDYRPFFTYWITTVQIVITICSVLLHGIGTDFLNGLSVIERSGDVLASTLSMLHIVVWEQNNVWIGPSYANLVHMGAKYTPCMRVDPRIFSQLNEERQIEALNTGCCIGPDKTCFQTSSCPKQFATFSKWINVDGRQQPVVCGQDPRFCRSPRLIEWTNRTDKWPRCKQLTKMIPRREQHMHCQISGRPCCIQMHGQCRITTREYCDFVNGYFHANAALCSQVSCLICGMTPFLTTDIPDQFYRFFLPLFIHAGLLRLVITCTLQLTIMRKFEIMIGWIRLSLIYFVSGVGGYLASASFVPYMPEVGPAGSQGGILGALIINVIYNWSYIKKPMRALFLHLMIAFFMFITGLLPYIDNWAQLFGFVFGILMAAALIPYFDFGQGTRLLIVTVSLLITVLLFILLLMLFYGMPALDIPILSTLNCPFLDNKVCDQQGLILRNWLPI